jgi:hypothetical protein
VIRVLVVSVLAGACSSTVLVQRGDPAFDHAQARLARTAERLERAAPPPAERWLFLQAESLYRYRFTPPARGGWSYVAEAAAALTDFPAFQAVAGSLDLADLRLRTYDGAIQLWESLLVHHPGTALRPLVLYRLGWAYHNRGVTGLPRETSDQAFDQLIAEGSPLGGLAAAAKRTDWRSKATATGLSFLPGLGQVYVGERASGVLRMGIALAAVAMVLTPVVIAYQRRDDLHWRRDWPLLATGIGGLVVLSIDYTRAYQDALRGVVLWNERLEEAFERDHPDAP